MVFDLIIRGGTIVTAGGEARADLGIVGGRVAQIGGELAGARELDATGTFSLSALNATGVPNSRL